MGGDGWYSYFSWMSWSWFGMVDFDCRWIVVCDDRCWMLLKMLYGGVWF